MRWTTFSFIIVITLSIGIIGCEGPQGPQGPQGPEGPAGSQGPQGEEGQQGNANVVSIEIPASEVNWQVGDYLNRTSNVYSMTTDSVDQDIIDHGTVLGYLKLDGVWHSMPFSWESDDGSSRQYIKHTYSLNTITLYAYQTSGVLSPNLVDEYRFLLITDNTVTAKTKGGVQTDFEDLDTSNYYEVMDYFGLDY